MLLMAAMCVTSFAVRVVSNSVLTIVKIVRVTRELPRRQAIAVRIRLARGGGGGGPLASPAAAVVVCVPAKRRRPIEDCTTY